MVRCFLIFNENCMSIEDQKFIQELFYVSRLKGRPAESSLKTYYVHIDRFFRLMKIKSLEDITMDDLMRFVEIMKSRKVSNSYIANNMSAMRWLVAGYIKKHGKLNDITSADNILRPHVKKQPVEFLTEEEVKKWMSTVQHDLSKGSPIRKARFLALACLLLHSGARIGEALSIDIEDINRDTMLIPVLGKGGKMRNLVLTRGTLVLIDEYLTMRKDNSSALFVALSRDTRWQQTDVNRTFKRYRELSGIKKKFTNHTLRHTFATLLSRRGVSLPDIQVLMGHRHLRTTIESYIGNATFEDARFALEDKHFDFISSAG